MSTPPFRPATLFSAVTAAHGFDTAAAAEAEATRGPRARLHDLEAHLHCSVVGTCLSTAELRKLMRAAVPRPEATDLEIHHEAVRLISLDAEVARALHRALERRHDSIVQRYAKAKDPAALAALWEQSLKSGEVPGAYWAVLTHRHVTPELRQRVFGEVHMLSHLVGAANRADIRRLVALEQENAELRERHERQQERMAEVVQERDDGLALCNDLRAQCSQLERQQVHGSLPADAVPSLAAADAVALQTQRREAAEIRAQALEAQLVLQMQEIEKLRRHAMDLGRELAAAETELRASDPEGAAASATALHTALQGRRLLYVSGRPSSNPSIRELVQRHGAEYQRHDGGIEDRKGLLAPAVAWADLVVFPVDCIDHDSALELKRACLRQGTPFLPLRTASVASFAAGVAALPVRESAARPGCACPRHG